MSKSYCDWCGIYYEGETCECEFTDLVDFDFSLDDRAKLTMDELLEEDEYERKILGVLTERFNRTGSYEAEDIVHEPDHYSRWPIEPITFIMRNGFEFWRGNIIKYASRAGYKIYDGKDQEQSEITDLQKVIRYAEMRINQINGETKL